MDYDITSYKCFRNSAPGDGRIIVEEFKSRMTAELPDYVLRRKLMVNKIYDHNERPNRRKWVFREVIYDRDKKTTITDK